LRLLATCTGALAALACLSCAPRTAAKSTPASTDEAVQELSRDDFVKMAAGPKADKLKTIANARLKADIILPGDVLDIAIYEKLPVSQEKRAEVKRVDEDGAIVLLPMGRIEVVGQTLSEAQRGIETALGAYVVTPLCEMSIVKRAYEPHVYVFGEVGATGVKPLKEGDRLLDVLAAAGGCASNAYLRSIKIIRVYDTKVGMISINTNDIMRKGQMANNLVMQDQDVVFVPRRFYTNFGEVMTVVSQLVPWYYFTRNFK
jgi:protein involved in polysaccharide export with SLBB domain